MTPAPDYGHDLLFGTFVTPTNDLPHHAVDQAVVAEVAPAVRELVAGART